MASSFDESLAKLVGDAELLRKLLYRNAKQHGKTKIFSYLRATSTTLSVVHKNRLSAVHQRSAEAVREVAQSRRITESLLCSSIVALRGLSLALNALSKAARRMDGALLALVAQLRKRVFAPLYSLLVALSARLRNSIQSIHEILLGHFQQLQKYLHVSSRMLDEQGAKTAEHVQQALKVIGEPSPCSAMSSTIAAAAAAASAVVAADAPASAAQHNPDSPVEGEENDDIGELL